RVGTFMERLSIQKADRLLSCCADAADFTSGSYGVPRESIDIVYLGVDTQAFRPNDGGQHAPKGPTVLFVGNITKHKGVHTVLDGETGMLVQPLDVDGVVRALDLLLGDPSLRRLMGAAARKRVEQIFSMDCYIRRVLAAYEKAIEASRQKLDRSREAAFLAEG